MDRPGALTCDCRAPAAAGDWLRIGLGLVLSGQLMVLGLALSLSTVDAATRLRVGAALVGLTALGIGLLGPALWTTARRRWAAGDASLEAMFLLALAGGLGASCWGLYTGGDVFFEVVTVVLSVHALGARVEERFWSAAVARAELGSRAGERAILARGGEPVEVDVRTLQAGDRVLVGAGGRVPADAVVAEGCGWLDTGALDGARLPVAVVLGASVPGGALLHRGALRLDLVRAPDDSVHERSRAALVAAWAEGSRNHALVRRLTRVFTPVVALTSLVAGAAWGWRAGPAEGFRVATAVLLVACPCGLGVATPMALWASASALGPRGVTVHRLRGLEALARARNVVLDKTGTLVAVLPDTTWQVAEGHDEGRLRRQVGAVEAWSGHPVAAALRVPRTGLDVRELTDLPGGGVSAVVLGEGTSARVTVRPAGATARQVSVEVDGAPAAVVTLRERLADGAASLVDGLRARGLEVEVLTGDWVAPRLGVSALTRVTPADKAARVRALRDSGVVVFVGDAANDLPALVAADVAVAVVGAVPVVAAHADLSVATPGALLAAVDEARALLRRLRVLLTVSVAGNAVGIGVAAAGQLHPVLAAVIMAGSSLVVTLLAIPGDRDAT